MGRFSSICLVTILFLSACNSEKLSHESQLKEDLAKVLNSFSQKKNLSQKLNTTLPADGKLTQDHLEMYVWVKARAMQLYLARQDAVRLQPANEKQQTKTEMSLQAIDTNKRKNNTMQVPGNEGVLSVDESVAVKELNFSPELYRWARQTIDDTVAFIESVNEPGLVDLVTSYDPAIKHNISLVKEFREKIKFVGNIPTGIVDYFLIPEAIQPHPRKTAKNSVI